ncbi:MAG: hypothetical protein KDA93_08150 [Planctomycetaceae bacterium]|nr:hypothetical protein [Planctomycetaceae bacterium]
MSDRPSIDIKILEQDGTTFDIQCVIGDVTIEVISDVWLEGSELILSGVHIDGPGPGTLSPKLLREAAREFGRQWEADRVIIRGGRRTTGAHPGHIPREIVIIVK